ncbi:tryptophan synthase subunit alpha [Streptomyces noursei]|uniref:tryptophan synthase subunit alpha n=1 Tax=Streptomyces noursei TaxID=1971 RepID=UPI0023B79F85|nr:tryptophan synthase subunit alpha [Streptomyces noursei]
MNGAAHLQPLLPHGRPALGAFGLAGYPTTDTARAALVAYADAGADLIEVGIATNSAPWMDGPDIALAHRQVSDGVTVALDTIQHLTLSTRVPVVAMAYWASAMAYGPRQLARDLATAGARGILVPDVPYELAEIWAAIGHDTGLHIPLLAGQDLSPAMRTRVAQAASGLVYLPAAPRTGHRGAIDFGRLREHAAQCRKAAPDLPVAAGVGLSTPALAAAAVHDAGVDAVIIGSPLLRTLAGPNGLTDARQLAASYARAIQRNTP